MQKEKNREVVVPNVSETGLNPVVNLELPDLTDLQQVSDESLNDDLENALSTAVKEETIMFEERYVCSCGDPRCTVPSGNPNQTIKRDPNGRYNSRKQLIR